MQTPPDKYYRLDVIRKIVAPKYGPDAYFEDGQMITFPINEDDSEEVIYDDVEKLVKMLLPQSNRISVWKFEKDCDEGNLIHEYKNEKDEIYQYGWNQKVEG